MPLLKLQISIPLNDIQSLKISKELSTMVEQVFNKPEKYVMVIIEQASILMSSSNEPAAFAELRSIGGINSKTTTAFSESLCKYLKEHYSILSERVYCNFTDVKPDLWGWNEKTCG